MYRTKIISAFPGVGKTFYHNEHKETTLDSDSSNFSWVIKDGVKTRNPEFPKNYIQHIKENTFIFVSSHKEVREALLDECIFFYVIYPDVNRKEEFVQRYKDRGSDESFIKLISDNWEQWIKDIENKYIKEPKVEAIKLIRFNLSEVLNDLKIIYYVRKRN